MTHSIQSLLEALQAARLKDSQLAPSVDLHCDLLAAQARASLPALPKLPTMQDADQALAAGRPLSELTSLPLGASAVKELADEICVIAARHRPELSAELATIRGYLAGDGLAGESALVDELLTFVLNHARRPLLRAWAGGLAEVNINDWQRPVCPFCGSPPDLGALDAEAGKRHLLCSGCDTEWVFPRVGCPFCGDSRHQSYFPGENERYRLYVCDVCRRYLKVVDLRQTWGTVMLPVERVLTVGMDLAGREAGYT